MPMKTEYDFSAVEARVLSYMNDCGEDNKDAYTRFASDTHEVPYHKVTPKMRREAKDVLFGVVYGHR